MSMSPYPTMKGHGIMAQRASAAKEDSKTYASRSVEDSVDHEDREEREQETRHDHRDDFRHLGSPDAATELVELLLKRLRDHQSIARRCKAHFINPL